MEPSDFVSGIYNLDLSMLHANSPSSRNSLKRPGFWEAVMPSQMATKPVWMTFDDAWVDEVQRGLLACRVFLWYPLYCKPLIPLD